MRRTPLAMAVACGAASLLCMGMAAQEPTRPTGGGLAQRFNQLDRDGDGKASAEEDPGPQFKQLDIGARVEARDAETGKLLGMRVVAAGHSYKSGSALEAHFGLGLYEQTNIEVILPSGRRISFPRIAADQFLDLNLTSRKGKSL